MAGFSQWFPRARRRPRRSAALLGGGSIITIAGLWFLRTCSGKAEASPCDADNDCKPGLICAETMEEGARGRKRASGLKLCSVTCQADSDCRTGLTCEGVYEHTRGPRGGKDRNRAKACVGD